MGDIKSPNELFKSGRCFKISESWFPICFFKLNKFFGKCCQKYHVHSYISSPGYASWRPCSKVNLAVF